MTEPLVTGAVLIVVISALIFVIALAVAAPLAFLFLWFFLLGIMPLLAVIWYFKNKAKEAKLEEEMKTRSNQNN